MADANSTEFDPASANPVIDLMNDQRDVTDMGGTMRLGAYLAVLEPGTKVAEAYGENVVSERHRHRWEFNNNYRTRFEENGMIASGKNPETGLVEIVELKSHPFFVGVQYHPELKSTVENPQPIFVHFVKAAREYADRKSSVKNPLLQSEMI